MLLYWLGILAYTFQIYYDFSGYSDMAIGLGRVFGFTFDEISTIRIFEERNRILAPLAHYARRVVPRLCLHSARRKPLLKTAPHTEHPHCGG